MIQLEINRPVDPTLMSTRISRRYQRLISVIISVLSAVMLFGVSNANASIINKSPNYLSSNNGLVGYWTMDGSKVNWATGAVTDSSGRGNTGTITNMATSTGVAIGKIGQALNFDGVDDYVSAPLDTANIVTVSVWAKMNKSASGDFNFVTQDGGTSGRLSTGWNGVEQFYIAKSGIAYHKLTNVYSLSAYNNSWHHIVFVYNSDNTQSRIYVDGIEASYAAASSQTITSDTTVYIGREGTLYTNGLIDEVRVYNRALSAKEIQTLYNIGATTKFNVSPTKYLTDGLVGYWTMDGSKVNWKTGAVTDSSGRGNTGTTVGMATSTGVGAGKIGQALKFDGVDDYVSVPDNDVLDLLVGGRQTISFWVRDSSVGLSNGLVTKSNVSDNVKVFVRWDNGTVGKIEGCLNAVCATSDNTLNDGNWHFIVFRMDDIANEISLWVNSVKETDTDVATPQGNNVNNFEIGRVIISTGTSYASSEIDDVRVYNRALSAGEIQTLYNIGATTKFNVSPTKYLTSGLVGYWTMDGSKVNWKTGAVTDSSGFGNTGAITNMATSTATAAGKIGQAMKFDGVNDYVNLGKPASIGSLVTNITVSAWINNTNLSGVQRVIAASRDTTANGFGFGTLGAGLEFTTFGVKDYDSTTITLTAGVWTHITAVMSGFNVTFYVNGAARQTITGTANGNANTDDDIYIGSATVNGESTLFELFNGLIDEVRVYNRALSANEVNRLYNMGR